MRHPRSSGRSAREGGQGLCQHRYPGKDGKSCDLRKLMALMGMGVKQGDTVTVKVEGDDEAAAAEAIQKFLTENV